MRYTVQVAAKTDVGCVRTNNEDNCGYDARYGVFLVCDGMGGAAAGEVASKLSVDTVLTYFRQAAQTGHYPVYGETFEGVSVHANALASAIQLANKAVYEAGSKHAAQRGMGSTVVAIHVDQQRIAIGHVGDSRIYLIRHGMLQHLTNDHSLVAEQVRRGLITAEEAERSSMQNIIIRALGAEETVKPDVDDVIGLPGDVFMMASDGLTKLVKDEWIPPVLAAATTLDQACSDLIDTAKAHGGDDNITCILVKLVQQPWYKRLLPGGGNKQWQNSF